MSIVEDVVAPLQHELRQVQSMSPSHAVRLEHVENRLGRNNVRAVGMPEKVEGKNLVAFIECWLVEVFGREAFSPMFPVERVH